MIKLSKWSIVIIILAIIGGFILLKPLILIPYSKDSMFACKVRFSNFYTALLLYGKDNNGKFPETFENFKNLYPKYLSNSNFFCPAKEESVYENKEKLLEFNETQIDYIYISGHNIDSNPKAILIMDKLDNHNYKGIHALYVDGTIEWIKIKK